MKPNILGLVSVHKSGTNLIANLIRSLGFHVIGHGVNPPWPRPATGLDPTLREYEYIASARPGTCYVTHSLPLFIGDHAPPRPILKLWTELGFPLLFNYRDPRAVFTSYISYVLKSSASGEYTHSPFTDACAETFAAAHGEERLLLAIDLLEPYMHWAFRDNLWLLHHPRVCKVRYEDLVGPEGGGSLDRQAECVQRVQVALGCRTETPSQPLYDRSARTFVQGQVDGWRDSFGPAVARAFDARYGSILDAYGYPRG